MLLKVWKTGHRFKEAKDRNQDRDRDRDLDRDRNRNRNRDPEMWKITNLHIQVRVKERVLVGNKEEEQSIWLNRMV